VNSRRLHLGQRLDDIVVDNDRAILGFDGGLVVEAGVVIGADGARSRVRRWITGEGNTAYSGSSGFRGIARTEDVPSLDRADSTQFWLGEGKHLVQFPIDPESESITFLAAVDTPGSWDVEGDWRIPTSTSEAVSEFEGWHPAVIELLEAVDHTDRWGLFVVETLDRWSRGPVVVIGDAAHAMLPHHGQGANQAIEDAIVLAGLIATSPDSRPTTIRRALSTFERLRKHRGERVQRLCWDTNQVIHAPEVEWTTRNAGLSDLHKLAWLHAHDAGALV
jgi:salicylate hydroxylase